MKGAPGWRKTNAITWEHDSGCKVFHCGHPTALWPYYCELPDGTAPLMHTTGKERLGYSKRPAPAGTPFLPKFAHLRPAQEWIQQQHIEKKK